MKVRARLRAARASEDPRPSTAAAPANDTARRRVVLRLNRATGPSEDRERGAVLVEAAIVLPLVMAFLFSVISYGIAFDQRLTMRDATQAGARYGAIISPNQVFTNPNSWAVNVRQRVIDRSSGELGGAGTDVCVSLVQGATATTYNTGHDATWFSTNTGGAPCDAGDTYDVTSSDQGVRVQVVVTRQTDIFTVFFERNVTQHTRAVAQSEVTS